MGWVLLWLGIPAAIFATLFLVGWLGGKFADGFVASSFVAMLVCVTLIVVVDIGATIDRITCRNKAANLELPYKWSMSAGCLVKVDGRWYDINHVQNVGGEIDTR